MLVVSVTRVLAYQLYQGCANTPAARQGTVNGTDACLCQPLAHVKVQAMACIGTAHHSITAPFATLHEHKWQSSTTNRWQQAK